MKVGFVVNQIETEQATYTTSRLAMAAVNRGHEAWLIGTGDLALDPDDYVRALEEMSGARISVIGVGPGREASIVVHDLLGD